MIKNKFAKWIEWLLDLLPLFAILFTSLYVTFNPNAKDSYSGNTEVLTESLTLLADVQYKIEYTGDTTGSTNNTTSQVYANYLSIPIDFEYSYFRFTNENKIVFYNSNGNVVGNVQNFNNIIYSVGTTQQIANSSQPWFKNYRITYESTNLDNNFEYSLNKFNDLGFDRLNFVNWFTGLFLNGTSNVYTTFINGYLNYFLLVECTYVLPMVLYWFIHLGERLISKLEYGGDK